MFLRMFVCMSTCYSHVEFSPVLEKLNLVVRSLYSLLTSIRVFSLLTNICWLLTFG